MAAARLEPRRDDPWHLHLRSKGRDPAASPLILLAHDDVVPAGTPEAWTHGAFSGDEAGVKDAWLVGAVLGASPKTNAMLRTT